MLLEVSCLAVSRCCPNPNAPAAPYTVSSRFNSTAPKKAGNLWGDGWEFVLLFPSFFSLLYSTVTPSICAILAAGFPPFLLSPSCAPILLRISLILILPLSLPGFKSSLTCRRYILASIGSGIPRVHTPSILRSCAVPTLGLDKSAPSGKQFAVDPTPACLQCLPPLSSERLLQLLVTAWSQRYPQLDLSLQQAPLSSSTPSSTSTAREILCVTP